MWRRSESRIQIKVTILLTRVGPFPGKTESKEYNTTGKGIEEDDDKVEKEKETVGDKLSNDGTAGPVSDDDPGSVPSDASDDSEIGRAHV